MFDYLEELYKLLLISKDFKQLNYIGYRTFAENAKFIKLVVVDEDNWKSLKSDNLHKFNNLDDFIVAHKKLMESVGECDFCYIKPASIVRNHVIPFELLDLLAFNISIVIEDMSVQEGLSVFESTIKKKNWLVFEREEESDELTLFSALKNINETKFTSIDINRFKEVQTEIYIRYIKQKVKHLNYFEMLNLYLRSNREVRKFIVEMTKDLSKFQDAFDYINKTKIFYPENGVLLNYDEHTFSLRHFLAHANYYFKEKIDSPIYIGLAERDFQITDAGKINKHYVDLYQKFEYSVAKAEYHKYDGEPKFNIELADKIGAKYILVYMNKLIKFVENPNKFKDVDIDYEKINVDELSNIELFFEKPEFDLNEFHHFDEVTSYIQSELQKLKNGEINELRPVLLVGKRGIGKSEYLKSLSYSINRQMFTKDITPIDLMGELYGLNPTWGNAKPGFVYKSVKESPCSVLVFDNMDKDEYKKSEYKSHQSRHLDFNAEFGYIFSHRQKFVDNCNTDEHFNTQKTLFIGTATDTQVISENILSQMRVFHISDVKPEEKLAGIKKLRQLNNVEDELENNVEFIKHVDKMTYGRINTFLQEYKSQRKTHDENQAVKSAIEETFKMAFNSITDLVSIVSPEEIKFGFDDIFGIKEAKHYVIDIMKILKEKMKYDGERGAVYQHIFGDNVKEPKIKDPIKGFILYGLPGTGKTMLASAFAKECGLTFLSTTGNVFSLPYAGQGEKTVKRLFETIYQSDVPCVLFIDEIDALGNRDERSSGVINEFLVQLDGIKKNNNLFIIAATNHIDRLDKALTRSGRFDKKIAVDMPTTTEREHMFKTLIEQSEHFKNIDYEKCARLSYNMSCADIRGVINNALVLSVRHDVEKVTQELMEESIEEFSLGFRTEKQTDEEKRLTAYHEAGHACLSFVLQKRKVVDKITVVPRSRSLGLTFISELEEKTPRTKDDFINEIIVLLGGMMAEKVFFNVESTGGSSDMTQATRIVNAMVRNYGMFSYDKQLKLVKVNFDDSDFKVSNDIENRISNEIMLIMADCYNSCEELIKKNEKFIRTVAELLYEKEVIGYQELKEIADTTGFIDKITTK